MKRHLLPLSDVPPPRPLDRSAAGEWLMLLLERASVRQYPQFLTLKEATAYTGLSPTFLRRLIDAGKLVAVRDGRLKVRRSDLDAMVAANDIAEWYTGATGVKKLLPGEPARDAAKSERAPG